MKQKSKFYTYLKYILLLLLGALLMYASLHRLNFTQVTNAISQGNFYMVIPVLFISVMVYFFRALRWQLLCVQINQHISKTNILVALCMGYLVNFAVPRMGEITRCAVLKKTNNIPINLSLSTVIFERTIDIICLVLITLLAIVLEYFHHSTLLFSFINFDIVPKKQLLYIGLVLLVVSASILYYIIKQNNKIKTWLKEFWQSVILLSKIKNLLWFCVYTVCIWCCYFFMTYLWFFTFSQSSLLSTYMAFQVMIIGSFARSLPLQAGSAGAYHYGVSQVFIRLGISGITANALAIIIHGFQSIFTCLVGLIAYVVFVYKNK